MTTSHRRAWLLAIALAIPASYTGCDSGGPPVEPPATNVIDVPPKGIQKVPAAGEGMPGPGGMMGGPATGIRAVMRKLGGGPASLTPKLGEELKVDEPKWDEIQAQAKEYVTLTKELGTYDPPKGSKESWTKLTEAYADTAAELEKAADAKDKVAATTAQDQLKNSCAACHKEHQNQRGPRGGGMGRGFGGPGGPGGGMGGPPPGGGPGAPPPGGGPGAPPAKAETPK